jgi:hypothetical protein
VGGKPRTAPFGAPAQPNTHGSANRDSGDGRLDPVRWRRPARGMLLRLVAVAALLATAAVVSWSPPRPCASQTGARAGLPPAASKPAAKPAGQAGAGQASTGQAGAGQAGAGQAGAGQYGSGQFGAEQQGSGRSAPGSSTAVPAGRVGVPIRLADPTALTLIRPGNRVDLLRRDEAHGHTTSVAAAALVLDVTGAGDPASGGVLLALTPAEAEQAVANPGDGFAVIVRPG